MKRRLILVLAGLLLTVVVFWFFVPGGELVSTLSWIMAGMSEAVGFKTEIVVPERPVSVSEAAVWAGGADGGAWLECVIDKEKDANWCTIWSDQTGEIWARSYFVLRDTGKPVSEDELIYTGFNGTFIGLADGRWLEPLKFHKNPDRDPWHPTPIDPPREGAEHATPPSPDSASDGAASTD